MGGKRLKTNSGKPAPATLEVEEWHDGVLYVGVLRPKGARPAKAKVGEETQALLAATRAALEAFGASERIGDPGSKMRVACAALRMAIAKAERTSEGEQAK